MKTNLTSPFQQQILEIENQLLSAMKTSDLATLDKLLHDDLLFVIPNGQTITKIEDLNAHRSRTIIIERISSTSEAINVIENTAVSISTIETKGKMLDQSIEGKFKYIRIWKLCEGNWKVIGGSSTAL